MENLKKCLNKNLTDDYGYTFLIHKEESYFDIKVTQINSINYVSRNQLHSTANLNFDLMGKKAKHCCALSTNFSVQFSS